MWTINPFKDHLALKVEQSYLHPLGLVPARSLKAVERRRTEPRRTARVPTLGICFWGGSCRVLDVCLNDASVPISMPLCSFFRVLIVGMSVLA